MSLTFLSPPFKAVKAEFVRQTVRNMPRWPAHVCAGKRRLQTRLSTTSIRTQSHSLTANRQVRGETSFLPDHDAAMSPPARARAQLRPLSSGCLGSSPSASGCAVRLSHFYLYLLLPLILLPLILLVVVFFACLRRFHVETSGFSTSVQGRV